MTRPPNFFTVAVLAVKNTPSLILPGQSEPNPAQPLLFAFGLYLPDLPPDPNVGRDIIKNAAAAEVLPKLPPGYIVSLVSANPIMPADVIQAAAELTAEEGAVDIAAAPAGEKAYDEKSGELVLNTFRPGMGANMLSPRYAIRCPYCGTQNNRFTGVIDSSTPDGFRTVLCMDTDPAKFDGLYVGATPNPAPGQPLFYTKKSPLLFSGPDTLAGPGWNGACGVAVCMICENGHPFSIKWIEDETATGHGPAVYMVFEYPDEGPAYFNGAPGSYKYPERNTG